MDKKGNKMPTYSDIMTEAHMAMPEGHMPPMTYPPTPMPMMPPMPMMGCMNAMGTMPMIGPQTMTMPGMDSMMDMPPMPTHPYTMVEPAFMEHLLMHKGKKIVVVTTQGKHEGTLSDVYVDHLALVSGEKTHHIRFAQIVYFAS